MTTIEKTIDITYHVEGFDERSGEWMRLMGHCHPSSVAALTDARQSAHHSTARYRVVAVTTSLVQEFAPGPIATKHTCPECHGDRFGLPGEPVTAGGWHGDVEYTWGQYAGVHMPRATAKRCPDCGHEVTLDADFDVDHGFDED